MPVGQRIALGRYFAWLIAQNLALDTADEPVLRRYLARLQTDAGVPAYVYTTLCHLIAGLGRVHPTRDWGWLRQWRRSWHRRVLKRGQRENGHRKLPFAAVPFAWWPQDIRRAWQANAPNAWGSFQHQYHQAAYGRFRAYCDHEGRPVDPTRPALEAYADDVAARLAVAAPDYLQALRVALEVLDPDGDWTWLADRARQLRPAPQPRKRAQSKGQRTLSLAFEDWPPSDQERWSRAVTPPAPAAGHLARLRTRREDQSHRAAGTTQRKSRMKPPHLWSTATLCSARYAYGAFLQAMRHLERRDVMVTPQSVALWVETMLARMTRFSTGNRVRCLESAMRLLRPDQDWAWLREDAELLIENAPRKRDKLAAIADVAVIRKAAIARMQRAARTLRSVASALEFQDGLIMLLLSYRPVRRRNLAEIRLGVHLQLDAAFTTGRLVFAHTKTGAPYEVALPARLLPWLKLFVERYRPLLAGPTVINEMWLSLWGKSMSADRIARRLATAAERELGRRIPPHLFRDCLATTVSVIAPERIEDAARLLGHRAPSAAWRRSGGRLATIETYRQLAGSAAAAARLAAVQAPFQRASRRSIPRKPAS